MNTQQLLKALMKEQTSLEDLMDEIPDLTFVDYLVYLADQQGLSKSTIIKKASLDRTYGYQIFAGLKTPGKNKILALSLAMGISQEETDRLLKLANQGVLYPKIKRDAIIIYALAHHYDLLQTNELLYEYGLEIIK
ncbi:MAG: hypothetical protein ACSW8B_02160 [bacterium]